MYNGILKTNINYEKLISSFENFKTCNIMIQFYNYNKDYNYIFNCSSLRRGM